MIKRTLCIILVFSFLAVFMTGCQNGDTNATDSLELTVNEISKHGNVFEFSFGKRFCRRVRRAGHTGVKTDAHRRQRRSDVPNI